MFHHLPTLEIQDENSSSIDRSIVAVFNNAVYTVALPFLQAAPPRAVPPAGDLLIQMYDDGGNVTYTGASNSASVIAVSKAMPGLMDKAPMSTEMLNRLTALPTLAGLNNTTGDMAEVIAELRKGLLEHAKWSKKGIASVAMTLQIFDAITGPAEDYHSRMMAVPVSRETQ